MDKAEHLFQKLAFLALTPFDVKNKEELKSTKGYSKEALNRITGLVGGASVGLSSGMLAGLATMPLTKNKTKAGSIILGASALTGAIAGDVRSLRKTEREAGVKPSGISKYLGRTAASIATLGPIGDYLVSRHLIKNYKPLVENNK